LAATLRFVANQEKELLQMSRRRFWISGRGVGWQQIVWAKSEAEALRKLAPLQRTYRVERAEPLPAFLMQNDDALGRDMVGRFEADAKPPTTLSGPDSELHAST